MMRSVASLLHTQYEYHSTSNIANLPCGGDLSAIIQWLGESEAQKGIGFVQSEQLSGGKLVRVVNVFGR